MATSKILLGPIPHARYDWVSGASYGKEAIVFHKGSSYIALSDNPSTEPSFTYDPATGSYNVSAGWRLLAVGAEIEQETGDSQDKVMSQKAVTDALTASDQKLSELDKELGNLENLNTNTKDTVVSAINEINEKVNSNVALSPELKSTLLQCFSKVAWSVEDGQSYLNSLKAALYPPKLLGIRAEYNGGVVAIGTSLADLDISVYAVYSNEETEEVTDYALSGEITSETNIITITYSGFTTTVEVNAIKRILDLPDMTYTSNGGTQVSITNGNHFKLIAGSDIDNGGGVLLSLNKLSSNNPTITNNASLINNQPSLFTIQANETITLKLLNVIEDISYMDSYGGLALGLKIANSSTSAFNAIGVGKGLGGTRPVQTQKTFSVSTDIGSVAVYLQLMASGSIIEFDLSMVNSDGKIYI